LAGSAGLRFEGEAEVKVLSEGDYILIPAHSGARKTPRRMDQQDHATIWLAVHYSETE
jgi:cupin 2 domain-containing protein